MASQPHRASARSVLSAPSAHPSDEDRQPRPAPQQSSAGPDEALHTRAVSFPVPYRHQLPATAAAAITSEAADPAAIKQRQYTFACWFTLGEFFSQRGAQCAAKL
ncbi:unnamed protein product [Pleuronectes platessa]|uniref:Uncharacterized protein n=1 Tax=Pleuronectes platessa TaxID=8262 RepID=A0A9N7UMC6_PLEPL|nr:unnamed protein product [Pleuronectes platessa]